MTKKTTRKPKKQKQKNKFASVDELYALFEIEETPIPEDLDSLYEPYRNEIQELYESIVKLDKLTKSRLKSIQNEFGDPDLPANNTMVSLMFRLYIDETLTIFEG